MNNIIILLFLDFPVLDVSFDFLLQIFYLSTFVHVSFILPV